MTALRLVIITVPPPAVCRRIDRTRRRLSRLTGSRAALSYPPHITLRTGALVPANDFMEFVRGLSEALGEWAPFAIRMEGLLREPYQSGGVTRYLVGHRIRKDEKLLELNRKLLAYPDFRISDRMEFNPHLTLLFEDLDRRGFEKAPKFLALHPELNLEGLEWTCNNVGLYALRRGRWRPLHRYKAGQEVMKRI